MINNKKRHNSNKWIEDNYIYQFADNDKVNVVLLNDDEIKQISENNFEKLLFRLSHLTLKSYIIVKSLMDLCFPYVSRYDFAYFIETLLLVYEQDVGYVTKKSKNIKNKDLLTDDEKDDKLSKTLSILKNLPNKGFLKEFVLLSEYSYFETLLLNENILIEEITNFSKSKNILEMIPRKNER